jgi:hypothetical protein
MLHLFHAYVRNVSAVSVLCCNKCFRVVSYKYFIWMSHMFHAYVSSVCYKFFICFFLKDRVTDADAHIYERTLTFMNVHMHIVLLWAPPKNLIGPTYVAFKISCFRESWGMCSSSSWLSGPVHAEREEGVRGKKLRAHMTEEAWPSGLAEREGVQGIGRSGRRGIFYAFLRGHTVMEEARIPYRITRTS